VLISHLLASPVPPRVRRALFGAATSLPGVSVNRHARDSLGRSGVRVSASAPHWQPARFMFDPGTGELQTGLPVDGGYPDVAGPASTVVAQGLVNSIFAVPPGVRPIKGVGAPPLWPSPPEPAIEKIFPAVGHANTVFTLMLAAAPGERPHPAPTAWLGLTGSGGHGVFLGSTGFDPCLPRASIRVWPATTIQRAGKLIYIYRFGPRRFHLHSWCPGRYQTGLLVLPNPLPAHYTTPPYTGSSGTSIYFEVR
jgi:hypothetical protein